MKPCIKATMYAGQRKWLCDDGQFIGLGANPSESYTNFLETVVRYLEPRYIVQGDGSLKTEWPKLPPHSRYSEVGT